MIDVKDARDLYERMTQVALVGPARPPGLLDFIDSKAQAKAINPTLSVEWVINGGKMTRRNALSHSLQLE